jgi:CheY-like chemotaxis protein
LLSLLDEAGYIVATVANGQAALNQLRDEPSDVIFLDLRPSQVNAVQVLATLKSDDALRDIPVILLARGDDPDALERCLAAGAEDYLLTPVSPTLLKVQVSQYLRSLAPPGGVIGRTGEFLKIERDLQVARIQEAIQGPAASQGWEVAGVSPGREVAGDFYDALMLSQIAEWGPSPLM